METVTEPQTDTAEDINVGDILDLDALAGAIVTQIPFPHFVLGNLLRPAAQDAALAAFPNLTHAGIMPAPDPAPQDGFGDLLRAVRSPVFSAAMGRLFGLPLTPETLMITLRARCRASDGGIHTDSRTKVVTALLYLNRDWTSPGGRLRLLRSPTNLDAMIAEVPPLAGTLVAFRRSENSYHGHPPFEGERRYIMLNWMMDAAVARRELRRHALSLETKRLGHGLAQRLGFGETA